jgi:cytochrome c-type biogenesis protein CcmE
MMKTRHKRLALLGLVLCAAGAATALVLNAFESNMVFFYSPTQVVAKEAPTARTFRVGGLVKEGSVKVDGTRIQFVITDTAQTVNVSYTGILPDLFKEGKGVVAQGQLRGGVFEAREVLAKHDENYMPPEAAEALKNAKAGAGVGKGAYAPGAYSPGTYAPKGFGTDTQAAPAAGGAVQANAQDLGKGAAK